jgi:hypothetical protein
MFPCPGSKDVGHQCLIFVSNANPRATTITTQNEYVEKAALA